MTGCSGTREKMSSGEQEVSLYWHTALPWYRNTLSPAPCTSLSSPPPPKIYSRNRPQATASACCCHQGWLCAEVASSPRVRARGRTRTLPACPEDQRKGDGGDMIRPRASPSFVCPAPLMSQNSAQIYSLHPANLLLTFLRPRVSPSPPHTPPTSRLG